MPDKDGTGPKAKAERDAFAPNRGPSVLALDVPGARIPLMQRDTWAQGRLGLGEGGFRNVTTVQRQQIRVVRNEPVCAVADPTIVPTGPDRETVALLMTMTQGRWWCWSMKVQELDGSRKL